jgi:Chaperone of endosialidase
MSIVKVQGNASGTGIFTVAAPNSNTDRTLTLPDSAGTFNVSGAVNEVPAGSASAPSIYPTGDTNTGIFFPAADTIAFAEGGAEAARIDSSGNLLVGQTASGGNQAAGGIVLRNPASGTGGSSVLISHATGVGSGNSFAEFSYNGSGIGNILQSGTTAVSYNTTSDYRLKESVQPMAGALAKVAALKPVTYKWKADGSNGQGFIAHELQAVVPDCVTGAKDAVDAEGNPVYQGIDTSFLVATLTAAIQELKAEVDALKAQLAGAQA